MADVWFSTTLLADLVRQATGAQMLDLASDTAANTADLTLDQMLQNLVVVKADVNDVVRIDATGWVETGVSTVVDDHIYELWSNAAAHLLIDHHAVVQPVM